VRIICFPLFLGLNGSPYVKLKLRANWAMSSEIFPESRFPGGRLNQALQGAVKAAGHLSFYPPVWVILFFGVVSVTFGLYFINREPTLVSLVYEFMVIFLLLSCIYFIYDLDTPFSGLINVKPEAFQTVYQRMLSLP
jgi:hypothetical protein